MSLLVDPPHELFGSEAEWRAFLDEMHEACEDGEDDAREYIAMAERVLAERRDKRPAVKVSARGEHAAARAALLATVAFEESEHPRVPKGTPEKGGQFTKKGEGGGGASERRVGIPGLGEELAEPLQPPTTKTTADDFKKAGIELLMHPRAQQKFLADWNERVDQPPEQFRKEFLNGLNGTMEIGVEGDGAWTLKGDLRTSDGEKMGSYRREIDFKRKEAVDDYFRLEEEFTGLSIGKKMLAGNIEKYRELGIQCVDLTANVDVGSYAWARYGFAPSKKSWAYLRDHLRALVQEGADENEKPIIKDQGDQQRLLELLKSDDPKTLWAIADSKYGKALLTDNFWAGRLDLNDRDTMRRFNDYIARAYRA